MLFERLNEELFEEGNRVFLGLLIISLAEFWFDDIARTDSSVIVDMIVISTLLCQTCFTLSTFMCGDHVLLLDQSFSG